MTSSRSIRLEDLEAAAHDGRLAMIAGFGEKRLADIQDSLAHRLGRVRSPFPPATSVPAVAELLDVDREYREKAAALFSNTASAHRAGTTRDRVVLYGDDGSGQHQYTVITANRGPLHGQRVVAGREDESQEKDRLSPGAGRHAA